MSHSSQLIRLLPVFLAGALLAGCSSTITNLTPTRAPRNVTGMYPVEVKWDTRQQTVRDDSLRPFVVVDFEAYPMRPTLKMDNRWETVIPVPADKNSVWYHFKIDYDYNRFGKPAPSSKLSPGYRLYIDDK